MPSTLTARQLHTASGTIDHPVVEIDDSGLIRSIVSDPSHTSQGTLTPTLLDIHTHGAAGHDVMQASPSQLAAVNSFLALHGVSHFLPTTVTASIDETLHALDRLASAIESPSQPNQATPIGIHLEGPFLSHARRGVHPSALLQPPDIALFERFHQASRGHILLLTLAPELPGALDLIAHCASLGIRTSLGHTDATAPQALAAIEAGASSATHTFNAMRPLYHRDPGVLATVLSDDRLYAELICDGIHVAPELVPLWLRAKGPHRAIFVTDSISATGMPDGTYLLGNLSVTVSGSRCSLTDSPSTLAGSVLTLDRAVANLQRFSSAPLATAVRLASHNPAALLGLGDSIANLSPGQPASFNLFDDAGTLLSTWLRGRKVS